MKNAQCGNRGCLLSRYLLQFNLKPQNPTRYGSRLDDGLVVISEGFDVGGSCSGRCSVVWGLGVSYFFPDFSVSYEGIDALVVLCWILFDLLFEVGQHDFVGDFLHDGCCVSECFQFLSSAVFQRHRARLI